MSGKEGDCVGSASDLEFTILNHIFPEDNTDDDDTVELALLAIILKKHMEGTGNIKLTIAVLFHST